MIDATEWEDVEEESPKSPVVRTAPVRKPPSLSREAPSEEWQDVPGEPAGPAPSTAERLEQIVKTAPSPEKMRTVLDTATAIRAQTGQPWEAAFGEAQTLANSKQPEVKKFGQAIVDKTKLEVLGARASMFYSDAMAAFLAKDFEKFETFMEEARKIEAQLPKYEDVEPATPRTFIQKAGDWFKNLIPSMAGLAGQQFESRFGEAAGRYAAEEMSKNKFISEMTKIDPREEPMKWWMYNMIGLESAKAIASGAAAKFQYTGIGMQEGGAVFGDLVNKGVDPAIATIFAQRVGAINNLIEFTQIGEFISMFPGAEKAIQKVMSKGIQGAVTRFVAGPGLAKLALRLTAKTAAHLGTELAQETAQELVTFTQSNLAIEMNNAAKGTELEKYTDFGERVASLFEEFLPALLGFAAMPTVGQARQGFQEYQASKKAKPPTVAAVKEAPTPVSVARTEIDAELRAETPNVEKARGVVERAATTQAQEMATAEQLTPKMINDAVELAEMESNVEEAGVAVKAKAGEIDDATTSMRLGLELPEMTAEETAEWDRFAGELKSGKQTFEEFRAMVDPESKAIATEDRPTIYEADLEGMTPETAETVSTKGLKSGESVTIRAEGQNFYAEIDGKTVGYAMPLSETELDVSVAQEHQRKGVGSALLTAFREKNPEFKSGGYTEAGLALERKVFEERARTEPTLTVSTADTFVNEFSEQYHANERQKAGFGKLVDAIAENAGMTRDEWVGQFNPKMAELTPEIRESLEERGGIAGISFQTPEGEVVSPLAVDREEVKGRLSAVFTALENADFHHGIGEFVHMMERTGLNQKQVSLLEKAVRKPRSEWEVQDIENIADNFEEYLGSGKAPSAELKSLFDEFADILYEIMSWVVEHLGKENLSKDWRKAFDSWFKDPEGAMASRKRADMRTKDVSDLMKVGFSETEAKLVEANKLMVRDLLHFKPAEWLVEYGDREFAEVNNRLAKELEVVENLFGPQDEVVKSYPVRRNAKGEFIYQRGAAPQDLADIIYAKRDDLRKMFDRNIPIAKLAKDMGVEDARLKAFTVEVESLRNGKALFDDEFEDDTATHLLSDNGKAGKSVDFVLATCHPTTPCKECYAARAYIRMSSVRKGFRNTAHVLIDPMGFAEKVAEEVNAKSHEDLPFVRLLGSGDLTSTEQVDAFNHLAELIDRPLHIFSRHHDMLAKLKNGKKAPFIKMGSIDSDLYDHYGPDYLKDNLEQRGIVNAFLYDDPKALAKVEDLQSRDAIGLVLSANHELHNTLPQAIKASSCPCDAGERTYVASCRRCALEQAGCYMSLADKGVDESGKIWKLDDEKAPDTVQPILGFKAEPGKAWSKVAEAQVKKSLQLIELNIRKHVAAKKDGKTIGISLKDVRYAGDITVVDNVREARTYQDNLRGVLEKIREGSFELPGGEIQPTVRYKGWVRMSDAEQWEKSATDKKTEKQLEDKKLADAALLHDSPKSAHNVPEPEARLTTEAGGWVDDAVLERYKGKRWVAEEVDERADLRELASYLADTGQAEAYDTFTVQAQAINSTKKSDDYYRNIWNSAAKTPTPVNEDGSVDVDAHMDRVIAAEERDEREAEAVEKEVAEIRTDAASAAALTAAEEMGEDEIAEQFEKIESELQSEDPRIVLDDPRVEKLTIQVEELQAQLVEQEKRFEQMSAKEKADAKTRISDLKSKLAQARKDEATMAGLVKDEWRKKLNTYKEEQAAKKKASDEKARLKRVVKKMIKGFMKPPSAGVGVEAVREIRELQAPYTVKETKGLERVKKSIKEWQAKHPGVPLVPEAQEVLNKRTIKDLSVQELVDLYQRRKKISKDGFIKTKERREKIRKRRSDRAMKLLSDIPGGVTVKRTGRRGSITGKQREAKLSRKGWFKYLQEHPLRLLEKLGPSFKDMFWDERKENEGKVVSRRTVEDEALRELYKRTGVTHREMIKKLGDTDYFIDTLMFYYGQMQDQDGRLAVLYGNDEDETDLSKAVAKLPQKFKDFADGLMDLNYKTYDDVEKVQIETKGVAAKKVRRYLPMKREQQITGSKFDDELTVDAQIRGKVGVAKTEQGFTNERARFKEGTQQNSIRTDLLNIIAEQIEKESTFVGMEEWNEDMRWILGGKSKESKILLEALKQKEGAHSVEWLRDYVNAVVRPDSFAGADANGIMSRIFRSLGTSQLMFKVGSVLIQVEGPFRALAALDYKQKLYLVAGLWKGTVRNRQAYTFMTHTDPVMAQIANYEAIDPYLRKGRGITSSNREVGRMLAYARQKEEQAGFLGLTAMAQWTVTTEWSAVYHAELAKTHDKRKAILAARDAVYKHQPSGNLADAPAIYWKAQQNMILRYLMRFTRASNQMAQMMFVDLPREVKKGHIGKAQGIIVAAAISAMLAGMRRRKRPPEDAEEFLEDGLLGIADSVGAVTTGVGPAVLSGLTGGYRVGEIKPLEAPYQAGALIRDAVEGNIEKKQLWNLLNLAGQMVSIPTPAIENVARTIYDPTRGDWRFDPIELIGRRPKGE